MCHCQEKPDNFYRERFAQLLHLNTEDYWNLESEF